MINKPCRSCRLPLNGGVFRRKNLCPHCMSSQNPRLNAQGKLILAASNVNSSMMSDEAIMDAKIAAEIAAVRRQAALRKALGKSDKTVSPQTTPLKQNTRMPSVDTPLSGKKLDKKRTVGAKKVGARRPNVTRANNPGSSLISSSQQIKVRPSVKAGTVQGGTSQSRSIPVSKGQTNKIQMASSKVKKSLHIESLTKAGKTAEAVKQNEEVIVTTNPFLSALNKKASREQAQRLSSSSLSGSSKVS